MESFFEWVKKSLPERSAMPPVLDLSSGAPQPWNRNRAWEEMYRNGVGMESREFTDPGTAPPSSPGSLLTTTTDQVGTRIALPAHGSSAVVVGKVISAEAHLAFDKHLVYSSYVLDTKQVLKPATKRFLSSHRRIEVLSFGGGIRFPSGHLEYVIIHNGGFMAKGKEYLFFLWKPIRHMDAYTIAAVYLLEDGVVYPISVNKSGAFDRTPVPKFEAAVKSAIADNVDR